MNVIFLPYYVNVFVRDKGACIGDNSGNIVGNTMLQQIKRKIFQPRATHRINVNDRAWKFNYIEPYHQIIIRGSGWLYDRYSTMCCVRKDGKKPSWLTLTYPIRLVCLRVELSLHNNCITWSLCAMKMYCWKLLFENSFFFRCLTFKYGLCYVSEYLGIQLVNIDKQFVDKTVLSNWEYNDFNFFF